MKRFFSGLIIITCVVLASCKSSRDLHHSMVTFKREDVILVKKDNKVLQIPYKNLKVSELMSVLNVENQGMADVTAYGFMTAWIAHKYPYEFTFYVPDSSHIINYYISEDSIPDLNNMYVSDLEVKVRSKQLTLDLLKDTLFID